MNEAEESETGEGKQSDIAFTKILLCIFSVLVSLDYLTTPQLILF